MLPRAERAPTSPSEFTSNPTGKILGGGKILSENEHQSKINGSTSLTIDPELVEGSKMSGSGISTKFY
jgi:hypothetical protein